MPAPQIVAVFGAGAEQPGGVQTGRGRLDKLAFGGGDLWLLSQTPGGQALQAVGTQLQSAQLVVEARVFTVLAELRRL